MFKSFLSAIIYLILISSLSGALLLWGNNQSFETPSGFRLHFTQIRHTFARGIL